MGIIQQHKVTYIPEQCHHSLLMPGSSPSGAQRGCAALHQVLNVEGGGGITTNQPEWQLLSTKRSAAA